MSAAQKKVIDDHCTNEWALRVAGALGRLRARRRRQAQGRSGDHEVYTISAEQLAEWSKAAEPVVKVWADNVKKAGGDPDAILKELKATLAKYNVGLLSKAQTARDRRDARRRSPP